MNGGSCRLVTVTPSYPISSIYVVVVSRNS